MGLIDLKTNLKSLKFGQDQLGGGSSNQPYVVTPIPSAVPPSSPDFVLRGGSLLPKDIANDETRLGKFFLSTEGVLFTAKQNLLSRTAVRTQASTGLLNEGVYTPISTLIEAGGVAFGLHVNKQGLNPFGGIGGINTYFDSIKDKILPTNTNRLYNLYDNIINNTSINNNDNILSYQGGPGSTLGIGKTYIRYALDNIGAPLKVFNASQGLNPDINVLNYQQIFNIPENNPGDGSSFYIGQLGKGITTGIPGAHMSFTVGDFRKNLKTQAQENIPNSPNYTKYNIEQRVNLGNPGLLNNKELQSYTKGIGSINPNPSLYGAASAESFDKINASIIYQSEGPKGTNNPNPDAVNNDLVKFRIGVINNNDPSQKTYIHFRAFLNQISDAYTAEWNSTRYIGRGENFYTYGGFDRKVSLSWTVAAQSKVELIPMYKKLNYLSSIITPDYSQFGYMRGNIVTLTIGGYFYEQPGIITGLDYTMNDENDSWEIGINDEGASDPSVKELPHIIRVTGFNFIPIHTFVPRKQQLTFEKNNISYGPERYIALAAGFGNDNNNYDSNGIIA